MEKTKRLYEELCREKRKTQDIAYFYLISHGIFPKDRYEVIKLTGIDPKEGSLSLCQELFNKVDII